MDTENTDEIIPEDESSPDPESESGAKNSDSGQPNLQDLNKTKGKIDEITRLAKGGPKPPVPAAAGESAVGSGAGTAGAAEAGSAVTAAGGTAGTGAVAGGSAAAAGTGVAASTTAAGAATASAPLWPWILIVGIVLLILILIILFIIGLISDGELSSTESPVSISKSGPAQVENGGLIAYSFDVSYSGTADDVKIRDPLPENTEYVSTSPLAKTLDASGNEATGSALVKSVEWSLKEIQGTSGKSTFSPQSLTLTVRPLSPDIYVINQAAAEVIGGSGDPNITPIEGEYIAPNTETCGGYYNISLNALNKNFGDPNCTMLANQKPEDKNKLYDYLTSVDPTYADYWFTTIIPCESSYRTNAYNPGSPASGGAWGLLQMGASYAGGPPAGPTPGLPPPAGGKNHKTDRGDVNWELQISNAVDYNAYLRTIPRTPTEDNPSMTEEWNYWQCANGTHP